MLLTLLDAIREGLSWLALAFLGYCVIVLFAAFCYGVVEVCLMFAAWVARMWRKLRS